MKHLQEGAELFDGERVGCYTGRLAGTFDLDSVGATISMGDQVAFFVVATAEGPTFKQDAKTGILKRHNTFSISSIEPLDPQRALWLLDQVRVVPDDEEDEVLAILAGGGDVPTHMLNLGDEL